MERDAIRERWREERVERKWREGGREEDTIKGRRSTNRGWQGMEGRLEEEREEWEKWREFRGEKGGGKRVGEWR